MAQRQINKLSVIIPAYNEARTIRQLLELVAAIPTAQTSKEIIVVNDASKDNTLELAQTVAAKQTTNQITFKLLTNETNLGKSRSVRRGILASSGDLVVIQDADLEYEPAELAEFLELFRNDSELMVVYGNRFGKKNKVVYWQNWFGNRFLTFVSNLFTLRHGLWVSDMEVCYKMVDGEILRELAEGLSSTSNFGFEPEITAKLARYRLSQADGAKSRLKYRQLPITYRPRTIAEGKHMKAFRDGFKALKEIIVFNLT